jgi:hypothetical protein
MKLLNLRRRSSLNGHVSVPSRRQRLGKLTTFVAVVAALLGTAGLVSAASGNSGTIDQCANGSPASNSVDCVGGWVNGDLNSNKSAYVEGQFVPFRGIFNSTVSPVQVQLQWQIFNTPTNHAYDYIGDYNKTVTGADPCDGGDCTNPPTLYTIPTDPAYACNPHGEPQIPGSIAIWNGTISSPIPTSSYALQSCSQTYGSNTVQTLTLSITVTDTSKPFVLAWGGHVATAEDWGAGNDAATISGSPYHMILPSSGCTPSPFSCTGKNLQLQAGVIQFAPNISTQRSPSGPVSTNFHPVYDMATVTGASTLPVPAGTITFYLCSQGDQSSFPKCTVPADGTQLGSPVTLTPCNTAGCYTATAQSPNVTDTGHAGSFCFLAVYTSTSSDWTGATDDVTTANQGAECYTISGPTAVTLTDFSARTNDGRGLMVLGLGVLGIAILGSLAFIFARKH